MILYTSLLLVLMHMKQTAAGGILYYEPSRPPSQPLYHTELMDSGLEITVLYTYNYGY